MERVKQCGGGVFCHFQKTHNCETIVTLSVPDPRQELLWLAIKLACDDKLIRTVCYHPSKVLYDVDTLNPLTAVSRDPDENFL